MLEFYKEEEEETETTNDIIQKHIEPEIMDAGNQLQSLKLFFEKLNIECEDFTSTKQFEYLFNMFAQIDYFNILPVSPEMLFLAIKIFLPFIQSTPTEFTCSFLISMVQLNKSLTIIEREEYEFHINELAVFDYLLSYSDIDTSYSFYRLELQNNPQADFLLTNFIIHRSHPNYLSFRAITTLLGKDQFSDILITYIRQNSEYIIDTMMGRFQDLTYDEIEAILNLFSNIPIAEIFNGSQIRQLIDSIHVWWNAMSHIFLNDTDEELVIAFHEKIFEILYQSYCIDSQLMSCEELEDFLATYVKISYEEEEDME